MAKSTHSRTSSTHEGSQQSTPLADSAEAPPARRAIWKGAITFGLVHVPVALYSASREEEVDFDWLDKRTMDPVGYKRVNKRTGKDIHKSHIVKGVKQDNGDYIVLTDDEISKAFPKTTQSIEIQAYVPAAQVSFVYLEKPYYLQPIGNSQKVYALLREVMADAQLIGIARLVIHSKEHLAALLPAGPALMVGMLRWANEIRPADDLELPAAGKAAHHFKDTELKMAQQLLQQMTDDWKPRDYRDRFTDAIRKLVAHKAKAGEGQAVAPLEAMPEQSEGNIVDLTDLLRRSLGGKPSRPARTAGKPRSAAA